MRFMRWFREMRRPYWLTAVVGLATLGWGGDRAGAQDRPTVRSMETLRSITEETKKLGNWDTEYINIEQAAKNIWRESGWNSEPDRYALELALDVARIPPWEFLKRFDRITERVTERYSLSEAQGINLKSAIIRESSQLMMRHARVMFGQVRDAVVLRANGKPFTPELIAEWTKESDPMMADLEAVFVRMIGELRAGMTSQQQAILDRDLVSFEKRMKHFVGMRGRWADGGWTPQDWGMQDDPIQTGSDPFILKRGAMPDRSAARRAVAETGAAIEGETVQLPLRWKAHDPTTWAAYVLDFKKRSGLDPGQTDAAASIHAELVDRAADFAKPRAAMLKGVPEALRPTHEAFAPIRTMFNELETRLGALLTKAQREYARNQRPAKTADAPKPPH